jgi:hypothetical protein
MRMGVPKGVAEWFIELDDGGLSFIDTPLYANTSNLHSHKDMLKGKRHMCDAKILSNCPLRLNVELDKEKVPVVYSELYSMTWYWNESTPRIRSSMKMRACENTATKQL